MHLNKKHFLRQVFYFVIFIFISLNDANAQQNFYASGGILVGKVVKNYPSFPEVPDPTVLMQVRGGKYLTGYKPWHKYYNYPYLGFSFIYGSLGNKNVLGNVTGLMSDLTLNQQLNDKFYLQESFCLGMAHYSTHYDEETNPENVIIGSSYTILASASLALHYKINNRLNAFVNVAAVHGSNSHLTLPNVGINIPAAGLGVQYHFLDNKKPERQLKDSTFNKKIHFNVRIGLGLNEQGTSVSPVDGPKYPIYIGSLFITKKVGYINKLQLGFEGYFNTGVYDYITSHKTYAENQKEKSYALLFIAGHEFLIGHFSVLAQGGFYLYNPFYRDEYKEFYNGDTKAKIKTYITAKLGVQYYIKNITLKDKNQLYAGCYIKTNFGQADFFETGLGWQF